MEGTQKFVEFAMCKQCKHYLSPNDEYPCHECLNVVSREFSHKPLYFTEATSASNQTKDNIK